MAEEARFTRTLHLVLRGLVLSVLLAVPVALLLPGLQSSRVPVQRAQCTYNLRQIALAFRNYASAHGDLPSEAINSRDGKRLLSWRVAILLCLEEGPFYQKFKLDEPWDSPPQQGDLPFDPAKSGILKKPAPTETRLPRTVFAQIRSSFPLVFSSVVSMITSA